MKKVGGVVVFLILLLVEGAAQNPGELLNAYQRNFAIASLDVKIQVLEDAAESNTPGMGALYHQALDFVLDNAALIPNDPRFSQLTGISVVQIQAEGYTAAKYSLWRLFKADSTPEVRIGILNALGVVGKGDEEIVGDVNQWLDKQNDLFEAGEVVDARVILAGVKALGQLGDPSSFSAIFTAMHLGYSDKVYREGQEALQLIQGDPRELFLGVIKNRPISEKKQALIMAIQSNRLADDDKGAIAEYALDVSLHSMAVDAQEKESLREMRVLAAKALGERRWSKAAPLVIEHFDTAVLEYDRGITTKAALLEAIDGLGNMSTHEAAVRLTQYLVLLNSNMEKRQAPDEQITLAVIANLGKLGDKAAFDDLLYAQYLNYSNQVKKAAKAALQNLKW